MAETTTPAEKKKRGRTLKQYRLEFRQNKDSKVTPLNGPDNKEVLFDTLKDCTLTRSLLGNVPSFKNVFKWYATQVITKLTPEESVSPTVEI